MYRPLSSIIHYTTQYNNYMHSTCILLYIAGRVIQWLRCRRQHPISECLVRVLVLLLSRQLPAHVYFGKVWSDNSNSWIPNIHMEDMTCVPSSWHWTGPALAGRHLGSELVDVRSVSVCFPLFLSLHLYLSNKMGGGRSTFYK